MEARVCRDSYLVAMRCSTNLNCEEEIRVNEIQKVPFLVTFFFIIFPVVSLGLMSLRYFILRGRYK